MEAPLDEIGPLDPGPDLDTGDTSSVDPDASSRRASTRASIRDGLLMAANELFAEVGYRSARTSAIARRAGVAEATLFRYFATKADLALFTLRAALDDLVGAVVAQPREVCPLVALTTATARPDIIGRLDSPKARLERGRLADNNDLAAHLCWLAQSWKQDLASDFAERLGIESRSAVSRALASAVVDVVIDGLRARPEATGCQASVWLVGSIDELRPLFTVIGHRR